MLRVFIQESLEMPSKWKVLINHFPSVLLYSSSAKENLAICFTFSGRGGEEVETGPCYTVLDSLELFMYPRLASNLQPLSLVSLPRVGLTAVHFFTQICLF